MKGPHTSLRLRVVPGAPRAGIVGRYGGAWKVRVSAPAQGGRANEAVLELLASTLDVPRRDLRLTVGTGSRDKVVTLEGLTGDLVEERLAAAAEAGR